MGTRSPLSKTLGALVVALFAATAKASADEVAASTSGQGIVIHGAGETLRDYCVWENGVPWLALPGGARFELIPSAHDPAIPNPGDGAFHPFDESAVRAALSQLQFPLGGLAAEIFVLPYPRRGALRSAAGPGLVLLSPGVLPLPLEQQHAEVVHELGHVVQWARMPDQDAERWTRYRELRGITDAARFYAGAPHADRPHEIFAEDFRALFGDPLANYSGSIENAALTPPSSVPGLEEFLAELAPVALATGALRVSPNPARGPVTFRVEGGEGAMLDLFDLAGRRVASVAPTPAASGWTWSWSPRLEGGPTLVLARRRGEPGPAVRVALIR